VDSLRGKRTPRERARPLPALPSKPGPATRSTTCRLAGTLRRLFCGGRGAFMSLVRRHPLISFFVLAYALSWWLWILYAFEITFLGPIFALGPFLAAIIVSTLTGGKASLKALLSRMVRWRVAPVWYAVALLVPVAIALVAAVFNVLLGAQAPSSVELGGWTGLFSTFLILLLISGLDGTWEEPGWRGYALPRLQVGHSALFASLILWVVLMVWHLPLLIVGEIHWSDVVFILGYVIVFNWVFNNANGSVLIIMLMHAMNNTISGSFIAPMFSGADSVRDAWLFAALWCAVALVVVIVAGSAHLSRKHHKQEEREEGDAEPGSATPGVVKPTPA
jgi:uncharacterized protein